VRRSFALTAAVFAFAALAAASSALADVKVSDQAYVRYDGGTDATIAACSTDNRQQNEPTVAVNPTNPSLMTAGANDYCTSPTTGDVWAGFYYSSNRGATWTDSLVPGYSTDTSAGGQASPASGRVNAAGDPVQSWDNLGHLYYGFIAFNRARPANAVPLRRAVQLAGRPDAAVRVHTLVQAGTPSPFFRGLFQDKIGIEVDRGASSPFAGNVYVCNARHTASAVNNGVFFYRSTDGGHTFSNPMKISDSVHGSQFCDIAVTRNGTVFVAWRQFGFKKQQDNAVAWAKSTDGGDSLTKPAVAAPFIGWDPIDLAAAPQPPQPRRTTRASQATAPTARWRASPATSSTAAGRRSGSPPTRPRRGTRTRHTSSSTAPCRARRRPLVRPTARSARAPAASRRST
jgi:hypothetical protein